MSDLMEWVFSKVIMPLVLIFILVMFGLLICLGVSEFQDWRNPPPTFELKNSEWRCTNVHKYTTTTYVMSGKVMVPLNTHHADCLQWTKN